MIGEFRKQTTFDLDAGIANAARTLRAARDTTIDAIDRIEEAAAKPEGVVVIERQPNNYGGTSIAQGGEVATYDPKRHEAASKVLQGLADAITKADADLRKIARADQ